MISEKRATVVGIIEHIEMEVFSVEHCVMATPEKEEKHNYKQRHLEHPLVQVCEEEPELEPVVQIQPRLRPTVKTEPMAKEEVKQRPLKSGGGEIVIEMEVFPPFRGSVREQVKSSLNKRNHLKWKRPTLQTRGLVVTDVVCLPRGNLETRLVVSYGKERAALTAMGLTARITIDSSWSANQMQNRLALLFRGLFVKAEQPFSFTYLQGLQGSRVLFVPDTPAEGWTGEQVLGICRDGALFIQSHHERPQLQTERSVNAAPVLARKKFCLEDGIKNSPDEVEQLELQTPPHGGSTPEELTLDLDTVLRSFRQENLDRDAETHIHVERMDLLHEALKVVRSPDFCFRTPAIISFSGEDTDGHEGPLREFFRLTLLELQESSVFEGFPGHLFLTYDLKALEDRKYYEAGVLIGWSLTQGGPGPRCLHPVLYQLMCGQNPSLQDFSWRDIVDAEAQIRLKQLHSCTDEKLLSLSLCDWVSSCGIPGIYSARSDEIPTIYTCLVKHHIYHRVASMISQFKEGMNSCGGLWDTVRTHWELFTPLMTSSHQQPLTSEEFKQLFTVCYSHPDNPLRAAEEATVEHWEAVVARVGDGEADFSLEDLLAFITGADHLPPLGFSRSIFLHFYSQDLSTSHTRLPFASTCALELFLPRGLEAAADLLTLLGRAVLEALGFTQLQTEAHEEAGVV